MPSREALILYMISFVVLSVKATKKFPFILKKYIPNIDIRNPFIKYQIGNLKIMFSDISELIVPLKSIFQINNCKNDFIECFKKIYSLHLIYSYSFKETSRCIVINLSSAISIPHFESFIIFYFFS